MCAVQSTYQSVYFFEFSPWATESEWWMGRERANVDACRNNNNLQTIHCIIGWYGEGVKEVVKYALLTYMDEMQMQRLC